MEQCILDALNNPTTTPADVDEETLFNLLATFMQLDASIHGDE